MKIFYRFIVVLLLYYISSLSSIFSQSNTIKFEHITVNEGLSHSNIHCIFQDSKGFMWFGTADGLNRFDGYNMKTFNTNSEDTTSISGPAVHSIFEDEQGNLWIGTSSLDIYNPKTERISHFIHDPNNPKSISEGEITCIFKDNTGLIWIGVEGGGLNNYSYENNEFIKYTHNENIESSISNNNISAIYQDRFGVLWIGTGYGLNKFDFKNKIFIKYYKDQKNTNSIGGNRITSIFEDSDGNLWIGANPGGLNKYNRKNDNFTTYKYDVNNNSSISSDRINSIAEDANKNLLVGTSNGFNILNKDKNTFSKHQNNLYDYYSLNNNYITSIFCDNAGIIWLGTYNAGINKYESKKNYFKQYKKIPNNKFSLNNNNITAISEDNNGNIWVGTNGGGLNFLNPKLNTVTYYTSINNNPYSLSFNTVLSLRITQSGDIWVGSNILDKFVKPENPDNPGYFIHYPENPLSDNSIKGSVIWTILEDSKKNIWIGALNYLNKIEFSENNEMIIKNYTYDPNDPESLGNGYVEVVYEDSKNNIWVGAEGLNRLKINKENEVAFIRYQHKSDDKTSLSSNKVKCIYEDSYGKLWIGTEGGGLNMFNDNNGFIHYNMKDGLPNDVVWGILEDNNRNLWISTNKGLARFNIERKTFKVFDFSDGLPGTEFNQNAYFKNKEGKLYFGGKNGLVSFFPDSIKDNPFLPKVVLTDFRILNKSVPVNPDDEDAILSKSISETEVIKIKYSDYVISFSFAALHYANPSKIDYKYKLEPIEKIWNQTNAEGRLATYTNLRPGKYTFKVKATNSDKVWNEDPTSIQLIVAPPFWLTWWAYIIYGMILISIFLGLRNFIVMRERYKSELQLEKMEVKKTNELNNLKLRFFTNISHEFRTPLTLILGPLENLIASKKTDNKTKEEFELMHRNASRLLRLVNQIMDFRKIESGKLKPELTKADIISFILHIADSFRNNANMHNIDYKRTSNIKYQQAWFDPDKIEKIIYNLLSNAFKHTPDKGKIELTLSIIENYNKVLSNNSNSSDENLDNKQIVINIEDTGTGISKENIDKIFDRYYNVKNKNSSQEGTGIGLELTKELVELHHGSINAESNPGKGSCFSVILPLGKGHYNDQEIVTDIGDLENKIFKKDETQPDVQETIEVSTELREEVGQEENNNSSIVLIVEDNKDVRSFIKNNLSEQFSVIEAENGQVGFDLAMETVPDIIVSDIMMPVMDGLQMSEKLKTNVNTSHIPIILLTAKASDHHKIEGLETGADDYMTKPFNARELSLKIKNNLESRRKLRERYGNSDRIQISDIATNSPDEKFLIKATEIVEEHMSDLNFDNKIFLSEIGMSRTQLYRKLKALTNQSVHEFIRKIRLNKAAQLLKEKDLTISEITFEIGFNNHSYFNKCFKEQFGLSPSEYIKQNE